MLHPTLQHSAHIRVGSFNDEQILRLDMTKNQHIQRSHLYFAVVLVAEYQVQQLVQDDRHRP